MGKMVAWANRLDPASLPGLPEVTRTTIKLAGIAWGWGTSKGWVGQGIAPEERAGVILHSQCSWGSTWRGEGFGPRWNPREGGFNGRWHSSQALWPGDAGDRERSSRLSVPSVPASTTCYFATSCVTQPGTCMAGEGSWKQAKGQGAEGGWTSWTASATHGSKTNEAEENFNKKVMRTHMETRS